MNIELLSHAYPTRFQPFNGTFVRDHTEALREHHNISLNVLTPLAIPFTNKWKDGHSEVIDTNHRRIRYASVPKKAFSDFTQQRLISNAKEILNSKADLAHLQFCYPSGLLAVELHRNNIPSVLTVHGDDFYSSIRRPSLKRKLEEAFRVIKFIIPVGKLLGEDIERIFPSFKDKIIPIHNYFRDDFFVLPSIEDRVKAQEILNFNTSAIHVLSVANMRYKKGIDTLIETIARDFNRPNIIFHVVGRLPGDEYEQTIRKQIESLQIQNVILHGPKSQDELIKFYYASDLFVLPSRNEPFGISILEAAACGLPVISTHSGGPSEIITEKIGLLLKPDDPLELSVAIHRILEIKDRFDPAEMRKEIIQRFGKVRYQKTYNELYESALK
jgi:glycosyltransferase involved in cell wall biosynthesis